MSMQDLSPASSIMTKHYFFHSILVHSAKGDLLHVLGLEGKHLNLIFFYHKIDSH